MCGNSNEDSQSALHYFHHHLHHYHHHHHHHRPVGGADCISEQSGSSWWKDSCLSSQNNLRVSAPPDESWDWRQFGENALKDTAPFTAGIKRHSGNRHPCAACCAAITNTMLSACDQRASCEAEPRLFKAVHVDFDMVLPSAQSQTADRQVSAKTKTITVPKTNELIKSSNQRRKVCSL